MTDELRLGPVTMTRQEISFSAAVVTGSKVAQTELINTQTASPFAQNARDQVILVAGKFITTTVDAGVAYHGMLSIARRAVISLLHERDFLGYQLAHANGSIDDGELDAIAEKYLASNEVSDQELVEGAALLAALVPGKFDADLVSVVFRCELDRATQAIHEATARFATQSAHGALPECVECNK